MKKWFRTFHLQLVLSFTAYGFASILYLHFYKNHISLGELFLAEGLAAVISTFLIAFRKVCFSRRDMQVGFLLVALSFGLLSLPFSKTLFFAYTLIRLVGTILFYVPYNFTHFQKIQKKKNLESMTWYSAVPIVSSIVGPLVGAWVFTAWGLTGFYIFALCCIFLGLYLTRFIPNEKFTYTRTELFTHLKGYRTINVLDGALHKVHGILLLFSLLYIDTEFEFGGLLSLLAGVSILGAVFMAKFSDKKQKRMIFLVPLSIAAGLFAMMFSLVHTFIAFLVMSLLLRMVTVFVEPIRSNILLDSKPASELNWIAREMYLNLGRAVFYVCAYIFMRFQIPNGIFFLAGFLHLVFPLVVYFKRVYTRLAPAKIRV